MRVLREGARVGVYLSVRGELDTHPIIDLAQRHGCQLFVPLIDRRRAGDLWFAPLTSPLRGNRIGIPEPQEVSEPITGRWLDLVFVPLVAFGPQGARLGAGAGYYDRGFAYLLQRRTWFKPRLIGLAYDWQFAAGLRAQAWDVPLAAVVTDRKVHIFRRD